MYSSLFVFLHVMFAFVGILLWTVGAVFIYIMRNIGIVDQLDKLSRLTLVLGGVLLMIMLIFGSIAFPIYAQSAEQFLYESFIYMPRLFMYKLSISSIACLFGFLSVVAIWKSSSMDEMKLSLTASFIVIILFLISMIIAAWVMSTASI